jgi:hypothetical protein
MLMLESTRVAQNHRRPCSLSRTKPRLAGMPEP